MDTALEKKNETEIEANDGFSEVFITKVFEKLMGQVLDTMRVGIQVDRPFNQAERNTRQNFNIAKTYLIQILRENGYLNKESNNGAH